VQSTGGPPESLESLLHSGYRYAISLTHHEAQAEDILQDAWLAVLRAQGPHTKPYLYTAIRSRFFNINKREKLVPMTSLDEISEPAVETQPEDLAIFGRLEDESLTIALGTLRVVEREMLFLSAVDEFTAKEIATMTGMPRGTVLSLIHRARHKMRDWFEKRDRRSNHEK